MYMRFLKHHRLLMGALYFFLTNSWAALQPLDYTLNATPATSIDLSGQWQIAKDPENIGKAARWFEHGPVEGAKTANVPNPLELNFPGYDGVVWYWRSFDAGGLVKFDDVRVYFQGADYFAEAWLNGQYLGGSESALLPFAFPAKMAVRPGVNQLVVRVIDASYAKEIDGFRLGHVPGGRQADDPLQRGWRHQNYGGLLLPVSVQAFRRPWIGDGFIQPDLRAGKIHVELLIIGGTAPAGWEASVRPVYPHLGKESVRQSLRITPDVQGKAHISLRIPNPQRWQVWDSFLYEISLSPKGGHPAGTIWRERFGMREVSILNGRIAINGQPILQRSYLYNQIWPVTLGVPYRDLARRDVELARRTNANMLRCFSKTPLPATIEAADELGILLQVESLGSWYLERGAEEQERLKNISERGILLYRNHPSILWWTVLNENSPKENPNNKRLLGTYTLREVLPALHVLDPTRPVLANDPVWHEIPNIWEPGHAEPSLPFIQDHYYQFTGLETGVDVAHRASNEDPWLRYRGRAWGERPRPDSAFLGITEWGQNSSPNWGRLMKSYEDSGVRKDAEDYVVYRKLLAMNRHWYEDSGIQKQGFPTFESLENANREAVAQRYREHFALFWGNVHSVGHSMTSLEDSSYEFSGVLDNWRNPKPLVFDTLAELNRPLQINLWVRPASVYSNDPVTFDATLVNEGQRLAPGSYSLVLKVIDSQNRTPLKREYRREIKADVIEFLMAEPIPLQVSPGLYKLQLNLFGNNKHLMAERPIQVFERTPRRLSVPRTIWVWENGNLLKDWLRRRRLEPRQGKAGQVTPGDFLVVLDVPGGAEEIKSIQEKIQQGAHAIILQPEKVLAQGEQYSALLEPASGQWKPELREIGWWGAPGAWGYARTALALTHPFLDGLPQGVALEAQPAYQNIAPQFTWVLTGRPNNIPIDMAVVESCLSVDIPYTSDLFSVPFGRGTLILNTLRLEKNLNSDPAADRILENIMLTAGCAPPPVAGLCGLVDK